MRERRPPTPDPREILESHLCRHPPDGVVAVYLFGSRAAGRAHAGSDVDVGVLLRWDRFPTARERFEARLRLAADLGGALGRNDVDLVVLNEAPPTLGRRIVTEGQRVFCAEPELDHAFVRDVQLKAADLGPFLRRTSRIKLDALRR